MKRMGFLMGLLIILSCGSRSSDGPEQEDVDGQFSFSNFERRFTKAEIPYQLSDTALLKNKDTAGIRSAHFPSFIPDSIKQSIFQSTSGIKYIPLVHLGNNKKDEYFIVKAEKGNKKAAILIIFNEENNYNAAFPFLVPDNNNKTQQISIIEKSFAINKTIVRKNNDESVSEGKEVYVFDPGSKQLSLVMLDLLDDSNLELINPIDTLARQHWYAADYVKDAKNIVSIRDGRTENELQFFIHFEKNNGDCTGEVKGTAILTSSKTAVFRQNPCILNFSFTANAVTIKEEGGCGSYRGVRCLFDGTYRKKKQEEKDKPKSVASTKK